LNLTHQNRGFARLYHSRRGLAIPVTFLILFVSTLIIVSFTYYFAVDKIGARSQSLKVSMARENMISLDQDVSSILWQSSSSRTLGFDDCGGQLNIQPSANPLTISITDDTNITATVFNSTVGCVVYELPYSQTADTGLFLKGDSRGIVNQNGNSMTQLYIREGAVHTEIALQYRPTISYIVAGNQDNKTVNNIRIYIVNLGSSQTIELLGAIPLKIMCESIEDAVTTYDVSYQPATLLVNANSADFNGQVSIPISCTSNGAIINVELVLCKIQIDRWVR
jgi:hypothetical protein